MTHFEIWPGLWSLALLWVYVPKYSQLILLLSQYFSIIGLSTDVNCELDIHGKVIRAGSPTLSPFVSNFLQEWSFNHISFGKMNGIRKIIHKPDFI